MPTLPPYLNLLILLLALCMLLVPSSSALEPQHDQPKQLRSSWKTQANKGDDDNEQQRRWRRKLSSSSSSFLGGETTNLQCQWWFGSCICSEGDLRSAVENASTNPNAPTRITLCRKSKVILTSSAIDLSGKAIVLRCGSESSGNSGITITTTTMTPSCVIDGAARTRLFSGNSAWLSLQNIALVNGAVIAAGADGSYTRSKKNDGGAVSLTDSTIAIDGCLFFGNTALQGAGGAISIEGGTVQVTATQFYNNTANDGGALAVRNASVKISAGSNFQANRASAGGAAIVNGGTVTIEETSFIENTSSTMFGGALALFHVQMDLVDSTFYGNAAKSRHSQTTGFDIIIADDATTSEGGTLLMCSNTVFCNGLGGILEGGGAGANDNSNCVADGLVGTPGVGSCSMEG